MPTVRIVTTASPFVTARVRILMNWRCARSRSTGLRPGTTSLVDAAWPVCSPPGIGILPMFVLPVAGALVAAGIGIFMPGMDWSIPVVLP